MEIKASLERQLKKFPGMYGIVAGIYSTLKPIHLMEIFIGTKAREREWAKRHLRKGNDWCNRQHTGENDEWVLSYWDSLNHIHRPFLLEKISSFYPFKSILEIGCNCGPNLYLIARRFPEIEITGIDINPRAIEKGRELFASEGISNVKLLVGKADSLEQFLDKSFDIVFTDAVLIYVGPDKIRDVVQEILRITRHALIFLERRHLEHYNKDPHGLGVHSMGLWTRDYNTLLKQFIPEDKIHVSEIPEEIWPEWGGLGSVIEVALG